MASPITLYPSLLQRSLRLVLRRCVLVLLLALYLSAAWLIADVHQVLAQANAGATPITQANQEVRTLEVGKPIERELAGDQSHTYQITLAAGQYLHAVVEQRGIDVVVTLFGPDGKKLNEVDSPNGTQGPEPMMWVTAEAGTYRLEVRSLEKAAVAGRYQVKVIAVRSAKPEDQALIEALALEAESLSLSGRGKYDQAIPLAERALKLREEAIGPDHLDVATSLNDLATLHQNKGEYAKAESLFQRALAIREKTLGPDHQDVAQSLNNLALLYYSKGEYAKAEPLYQRALTIHEKALGPDHPDVAASLHNLAVLYYSKGEYVKAEAHHQRALTIWEKVLGPNHPNVAQSLNNLALLYQDKGEYVKAEPLLQRALAIREKTLGPDHPRVATSLNNLAVLYRDKGEYVKAEPLYQRALVIWEKALGPGHPLVATSLNNLAGLYRDKGEYVKAEPLFQRALANLERALGPDHPDVAASLNNLAGLYEATGEYAKAEPLFQRALAIREKALGSGHPDVATSLHNFASLYRDKGEYAKSEPLFQRALAIYEKSLGSDHPNLATLLNNLASLYRVTERTAQSLAFQHRAAEMSELNLGRNLAAGSERQKLSYLTLFADQTNQILSLHTQFVPNDSQALHLALTTLLRRKGRALDAMTDLIATLRRRANAQDQVLLDQLASARAQLSTVTLRGPGKDLAAYRSRLTQLEAEVEKFEADLSARSSEFRAQATPVTVEAVLTAIPAQAAIVEFASYRPFNAKYKKTDEKFGEPHYVAYVLRQRGASRWVELGEARKIDQAVTQLREALRNPKRADVRRLARRVDRMVMQPVRARLGKTRRVFISPDGALNLIPFAALVDEHNQYLVKRYEFSYLTSGRDLLRLQVKQQSKQGAMVVADPDFGELAGNDTTAKRDLKLEYHRAPEAATADSFSLADAYFPPLPGTAGEAAALKAILPDATALTRAQATEAALKQASSPRVLHIATHGFFLSDLTAGTGEGRELKQVGTGAGNQRIENPLLRSGLALAGANLHKSGDDDGVLTALEAAGLDLWGTKLVVLSACDTGVGEVKSGDGVYGLRRALVLAGSETQVMSLWPVSDTATRDLMIEYYRALQRGEGRTAGLRGVQLRMLAGKWCGTDGDARILVTKGQAGETAKDQKRARDYSHPYYWASFIQSGEWANLDGKR